MQSQLILLFGNLNIFISPFTKTKTSGGALGSCLEGRGFNPRPMLDESGVKAMPESISAPSSGSLQKIRKIQVVNWDTQKITTKK